MTRKRCACGQPLYGRNGYCRIHYVARLRSRRRYRRLLGLCFDCLQRALPGKTRCVYHLIQDNGYKRVLRAKRVTRRGWKMQRVPA